MGIGQYMIEFLNQAELLDDAYIQNIVALLAFVRNQYKKVLSGSYLIWNSLLSGTGREEKWKPMVP